jgi:DNA-directed RNA polymerase specialized sigma24 family protein
MACLANDQSIDDTDLELLRGVARGQKQSLAAAVERFHPVLLAVLFDHLKNFTAAQQRIEPIVRGLFRSLLKGELAPEEFAREATRRIATEHISTEPGDGSEPEALHSLHGAGKLVRRRAACRAINELPPNALLAAVLRYHAGWTAEQMVGIVADTPDGVQVSLVAGHRAVIEAMRAGD